jgi:DNA-binding IclR family transcriptional regulator
MLLIAHESLEAAQESASILRALGGAARRLLAECVEHTGVKRKTLSAAAHDLEAAGFLFVRDQSTIWSSEFDLVPTLAGEEALEVLEETTA